MMATPMIPTPGIFIPTQMIFHPQLPPAVRVTWIQLRYLVRDGRDTSSLSIRELIKITGKSQATLYRHMSQLRRLSILLWHSTARGSIILFFPDESSEMPESRSEPPDNPNSKCQKTESSELPDPYSYFPARILGYLSYQEDPSCFSTTEVTIDEKIYRGENSIVRKDGVST
jgi:hypothetical protein